MMRPGDFSALWPALSVDARDQVEAEIAGVVQAEQAVCCQRLRELVKQLPSVRERRRLLAFLDVLIGVDLVDVAKEA